MKALRDPRAKRADRLTPRLIEALYVEALLLQDEAQACFEEGNEGKWSHDGVATTLFAQLDAVLGWLRTRRAEPDHTTTILPPFAPIMDHVLIGLVPGRAGQLAREARDLHARIERIERGGVPAPATPGPARLLIAHLGRAFRNDGIKKSRS